MRVLDIDLDFFLSDVVNFQQGDERPSEDQCAPWPDSEVRVYLQDNLGLATEARIPGTILSDRTALVPTHTRPGGSVHLHAS